jgi:hypothetical protein
MERLKPTSTSSNKIKDEMIAYRELLVLFSRSDAPNGQGAFGILCNMHQLLIFICHRSIQKPDVCIIIVGMEGAFVAREGMPS